MLAPGRGRAAIVVPQSILNNPSLDYVRKWLLAHTQILAVVELPVETFLMSGREGTGTLTAILVVKRREVGDTLAILEGKSVEPYPIYMSIAHYVGYDRRGKTAFRREKDGTEITTEVPMCDPNSGEVIRVGRERIVANDLPAIAEDYLQFRDRLARGEVYFDSSRGMYRVVG